MLIEGRINNAGVDNSFEFNVVPISETVEALAPEQRVETSIDTVGQQQGISRLHVIDAFNAARDMVGHLGDGTGFGVVQNEN